MKEEAEEKLYDKSQKFNECEENDKGLLAIGEYNEDDKEAYMIWKNINKHINTRRNDGHEARLK